MPGQAMPPTVGSAPSGSDATSAGGRRQISMPVQQMKALLVTTLIQIRPGEPHRPSLIRGSPRGRLAVHKYRLASSASSAEPSSTRGRATGPGAEPPRWVDVAELFAVVTFLGIRYAVWVQFEFLVVEQLHGRHAPGYIDVQPSFLVRESFGRAKRQPELGCVIVG